VMAAAALGAQPSDRVISGDTLFFAEGMDIDRQTGTMYVTSIYHRSVLVVPPAAAPYWLFDAAQAGTAAVTGIALDAQRGVAWLATARHPRMRPIDGDAAPLGELIAVRLTDGSFATRHTLGDGTSTAGEITVAPNGEVLVSDGLLGVLYR